MNAGSRQRRIAAGRRRRDLAPTPDELERYRIDRPQHLGVYDAEEAAALLIEPDAELAELERAEDEGDRG